MNTQNTANAMGGQVQLHCRRQLFDAQFVGPKMGEKQQTGHQAEGHKFAQKTDQMLDKKDNNRGRHFTIMIFVNCSKLKNEIFKNLTNRIMTCNFILLEERDVKESKK